MVILFILGLFIGSFLGVLVDRIPRKENVIKGHSHCENCKKELSWYDLLPVFSYVFLKGKCRYCKTKLPLFYPVIEITTGILLSLVYFFFYTQNAIVLSYYLIIVSVFIVIFFTDLKYGIIPNKVIFPAIIVSFVFLFFQRSLLLNHVLSGLLSFAFFIVISYSFFMITKRESMGGGDIKLSFFLGLFLGFPNIIVSLYLAFLTGALVSIILILWKKKSFQKDTLPFGSFMALGALVSLFLGNLLFLRALILLGL